jgi:hypothetical protein
MHCFQNALAYFATAVSHECKKFIKLIPGAKVIKLFSSKFTFQQNKLEYLSAASFLG